MNNSKLPKSSNGSSCIGRERGIVLSPQGWQRFQIAKQQAESEQIWGKHLTPEELSERTGLSLNDAAIDRRKNRWVILFAACGDEVCDRLPLGAATYANDLI